jgi:2-polyprenyl-3-methyl-5-hydroxy-6-metoxy-1,4-benzoquinol methylase
MLITDGYRALNEQLHANPRYGSRRRDEIYKQISELINQTGSETLLDYGCGKGAMADCLDNVTLYDPCVSEFSRLPGPHDFVACCDVLEHVEPELLSNVLIHIEQLAQKAVYLVISTRAASKTLADGRNAHLIVKGSDWWHKQIEAVFVGWELHMTNSNASELTVFGVKYGSR